MGGTPLNKQEKAMFDEFKKGYKSTSEYLEVEARMFLMSLDHAESELTKQ